MTGTSNGGGSPERSTGRISRWNSQALVASQNTIIRNVIVREGMAGSENNSECGMRNEEKDQDPRPRRRLLLLRSFIPNSEFRIPNLGLVEYLRVRHHGQVLRIAVV